MFRLIECPPMVHQSKLMLALPLVLATIAALFLPLAVQAAPKDGMVQTQITSSLATNTQTDQSPAGITWALSVQQASLINTPIAAQILEGSCTGNPILALPSQNTDGSGSVDWGSNWFQYDVNGNPIPLDATGNPTIPTDPNNLWYLNLQDTASGDNPSIACIPIQTQTPGYWAVGNYGTSNYVIGV